MTEKILALQRSAAILTATSRAFDLTDPGLPPPALLIEGESTSSTILSSRKNLERMAKDKGISLFENASNHLLRSHEADFLEIYCSTIFEPCYPPMKQLIKDRLKAAEGSSGFFFALHDTDQASLESQALVRELLAEGCFDGEPVSVPLFVMSSSRNSFELPAVHNALVLRRSQPRYHLDADGQHRYAGSATPQQSHLHSEKMHSDRHAVSHSNIPQEITQDSPTSTHLKSDSFAPHFEEEIEKEASPPLFSSDFLPPATPYISFSERTLRHAAMIEHHNQYEINTFLDPTSSHPLQTINMVDGGDIVDSTIEPHLNIQRIKERQRQDSSSTMIPSAELSMKQKHPSLQLFPLSASLSPTHQDSNLLGEPLRTSGSSLPLPLDHEDVSVLKHENLTPFNIKSKRFGSESNATTTSTEVSLNGSRKYRSGSM